MLPALFLLASTATATHIRAGEITARRLDPQSFTYEITLRGYADRDSQVIFGSNGTIDFGDGTSRQLSNNGYPDHPDYFTRYEISPDTWMYELKVVHTFPSARTYTISFREFYRNQDVLNMDVSVNMPFYVETVIVIDPYLGVNNTPVLLVPPIEKAAIGKVYMHNAGAYDVDGDSLSYRLATVRQDKNTPVANFRQPHQTFPVGDARNGTSLSGGPSIFTMDPITGDLVWNTPGTKGQYNVAFYVEEWRKINGRYYQLGYVIRDMQIIVEDTENQAPVIDIAEDICVVAGEAVNRKIKVTDSNGDLVSLQAYSGVLELGANFAGGTHFTTPLAQAFTWQTQCTNVRQQPYQVVFRATDIRESNVVRLTGIRTWNIRVVGPQPVIESVSPEGSRAAKINFNRNNYTCTAQASAVQVWRRVGSVEIPIDTCITGMPSGYGYELIDARALNSFPFTDNAGGAGLKPGATYCYRMVVAFRGTTGGESLVSEEVCVTLPAKMPLITNVSVQETKESNGKVYVRWLPGPNLTEGEVLAPHTYDLYRTEVSGNSNSTKIANNTSSTEFTDTGSAVNTKDKVYKYHVVLRDANGAEIGSSDTASTVSLTAVSKSEAIQLQWQATVPWSNKAHQYPTHAVYRNHVNPDYPDEMVLLTEINVEEQGFTFEDTGSLAGVPLKGELEYCYQVTTVGSYSNPKVADPLRNNSQIICASTEDVPTGLHNQTLSLLKVHPNPLRGQTLYISLPEAIGKNAQLQIYDIQGRVILEENILHSNEEHPVVLPETIKGMYLLLLQYNGKQYRNKLIVQ